MISNQDKGKKWSISSSNYILQNIQIDYFVKTGEKERVESSVVQDATVGHDKTLITHYIIPPFYYHFCICIYFKV